MMKVLHLLLSVFLCFFIWLDYSNGTKGFIVLPSLVVPFWIAIMMGGFYLITSVFDVLEI